MRAIPVTPLQPHLPPARVRDLLLERRIHIQGAFHESLEYAVILTAQMRPKPRSLEVATLAHFFLNVPALEAALNAALKPLRVSVKGVFGHYSRPFGPVVDYDDKPPGCELCDMLFVVTYGPPTKDGPFGNASFFQAKLERKGMLSGKSSKRQAGLYRDARSFVLRNPSLYDSGLPEDVTPGWREMPGSSTTGFCFWSYNQRDGHRHTWPWEWHASAVTAPDSFPTTVSDRSFGEALFGLMAGQFGVGVSSPAKTDFGWNRIVYDFLFRAAKEPLGYTYGVANSQDVRRISADPNAVNVLFAHDIGITVNPLGEFFSWFGTGGLTAIGKAYDAQKSRIGEPGLRELLENPRVKTGDDAPPNTEPPDDQEFEPGPEDDGGGGSFIQINIGGE